jgi:hypothetical protein
VAHTTAAARVDLAKRKSREIAKRIAELEGGAPRATGSSFKSAFQL